MSHGRPASKALRFVAVLLSKLLDCEPGSYRQVYPAAAKFLSKRVSCSSRIAQTPSTMKGGSTVSSRTWSENELKTMMIKLKIESKKLLHRFIPGNMFKFNRRLVKVVTQKMLKSVMNDLL